jgi:hypothetical protein
MHNMQTAPTLGAELPGHPAEVAAVTNTLLKNVPVLILTGSNLRWSLAFNIRTVCLSLSPLALNIALLLLGPGHAVTGTAWVWLAYFGLIALYLLQTHRYLFWRFVSVAPYFDALLPARKDRESLTHILVIASRKSLQLAVSIGCAVIFVFFAWTAAPALAHRLSIGPASYLAVFIVIFLAAHGGYWIIVTVILLRTLRKKRSVAVRRLDPLRTPALLELNKFYGAAGTFTTTVFPITEVPIIFAFLLAHGTLKII